MGFSGACSQYLFAHYEITAAFITAVRALVAGVLLGAFEPLGAMVVSAVWLATAFSAADWAGFALMIAMLVLVTLPGGKKAGNT